MSNRYQLSSGIRQTSYRHSFFLQLLRLSTQCRNDLLHKNQTRPRKIKSVGCILLFLCLMTISQIWKYVYSPDSCSIHTAEEGTFCLFQFRCSVPLGNGKAFCIQIVTEFVKVVNISFVKPNRCSCLMSHICSHDVDHCTSVILDKLTELIGIRKKHKVFDITRRQGTAQAVIEARMNCENLLQKASYSFWFQSTLVLCKCLLYFF